MYGSRISDSRKYEEAVIREKCREPNSYMVQIPATGQCFRRNSNFIKPRQSEQNSVSTELQSTTVLPEIPQEPPAFQQPAAPSSQATSTVDAIPTVPPSKQNDNSTPRTSRTPQTSSSIQKKYQRNSTRKAWTTRVTLRVQTFLFQKGRCCDMGQNDTIGKIESKSIFRPCQVMKLIARMTFNCSTSCFDELSGQQGFTINTSRHYE